MTWRCTWLYWQGLWAESYSHLLFTVLTHPSFSSHGPVFISVTVETKLPQNITKIIILNKLLFMSATYCIVL